MDSLTDLAKLIALADAARDVMDSQAAADNETLRRSAKAAAVHASKVTKEIKAGMKGVDCERGNAL